jgi:hypothetical protein
MLRLTEIAIESRWTLAVFSSSTIKLLIFARLESKYINKPLVLLNCIIINYASFYVR